MFYLRSVLRVAGFLQKQWDVEYVNFSNLFFARKEHQLSKGERYKIYVSTCIDPFYNLALEDWIFKNEDFSNYSILYLWRNKPSVVLGRNQNPWLECEICLLAEEGVHLVRRNSGGGAVYHDLGNLNFTLFSKTTEFERAKLTSMLVSLLNDDFHFSSSLSQRNDIMLGSDKISGSAYKISGPSAYHHCTLLYDADLSKIKRFLNPTLKGIQGSSVGSIPSATANIKQLKPNLDLPFLINNVVNKFCNGSFENTIIISMDPSKSSDEKIINKANLFKSWDWIYGSTPRFTQKVNRTFWWGDVTLELLVEKGLIVSVQFYYSNLQISLYLQKLGELLKGKSYGVPITDEDFSPDEMSTITEDMLVWLKQVMY